MNLIRVTRLLSNRKFSLAPVKSFSTIEILEIYLHRRFALEKWSDLALWSSALKQSFLWFVYRIFLIDKF